MKIFNKYHTKRTENWYFEGALFVKAEKVVVGLELNLPTPKDKSVFFGIILFTCCIFFFEIAWVGPRKTSWSDNHLKELLEGGD